MKRISVESSTIKAIGYDEEDNFLSVEFNNGSVYNYSNVTDSEFLALLNAESVGKHFIQHIKPKKFLQVRAKVEVKKGEPGDEIAK